MRRSTARRFIVAFAAVVVLLCVGLFVVLPWLARRGVFDAAVARKCSDAVGVPVAVGGIQLSVLGGVTIDSLSSVDADAGALHLDVERIDLADSLWNILAGRVRRINVTRPEVRLPRGELERIMSADPSQFRFGVLSVIEGSATLELAARVIELREVDLTLTEERSSSGLRFRSSATTPWGVARVVGVVDLPLISVESLEWDSPNVGSLTASGAFNTDTREIADLDLRTSDLDLQALTDTLDMVTWPASLTGAVRLAAVSDDTRALQIDFSFDDVAVLPPDRAFVVRKLHADGTVRIEPFNDPIFAEVSLDDLSFSCDVTNDVLDVRAPSLEAHVVFPPDVAHVSAVIDSPSLSFREYGSDAGLARVDVQYDLSARELTLELDSPELAARLGDTRLLKLDLQLHLLHELDSPQLDFSLDLADERLGKVRVENGSLNTADANLTARLTYTGETLSFLCDVTPLVSLDCEFSRDALTASGTVSLENSATGDAVTLPVSVSGASGESYVLSCDPIDIEDLWTRLGPLLGDAAGEWVPAGELSLSLRTFPPSAPSGPWTLSSEMELSGAGLQTPSFNGFENLNASLHASLDLAAVGRAEFHVELADFQYAFDLLFGDYADKTASLTGAGDVSLSPLTFTGWQGEVTVADTLHAVILDADLAQDASAMALSLSIDGLELSPVFTEFIRNPYGEVYPFLADAVLDGKLGCRRLDLRVSREDLSARGVLDLEEVSFRVGPITAQRLTGALPFHLGDAGDLADLKGDLAVDDLTFGGAVLEDRTIALEAHPSGLRVTRPLSFRVPGGRFVIAGVVCGWQPGADLLRCRLDADHLDMAFLSGAFLPGEPFPGDLSCSFDKVSLTPEGLTASGKAVAGVFGGSVEITDVSANDLFSAVRSYRFAARTDDIDLVSLSSLADLGTIAGRLRGEITDFEISAGLPNAWSIHLETVGGLGVSQWVSPDFVNNMTYFTSGFIMKPLEGAFRRKKLPYSRFSLTSRLHNDRIVIEGFRSGNKEYFMKAGLFGGVNIINANPGVAYSFPEIFDRLRHVVRGDVAPQMKVE